MPAQYALPVSVETGYSRPEKLTAGMRQMMAVPKMAAICEPTNAEISRPSAVTAQR
jgi:hypothetical protein